MPYLRLAIALKRLNLYTLFTLYTLLTQTVLHFAGLLYIVLGQKQKMKLCLSLVLLFDSDSSAD